MTEPAKKVNIRVPAQLYYKIEKSEMTITEAIVKGLELLFKEDEDININDVIELKNGQMAGLQERIESLERQLDIKDNQIDKLNGNIHELSDTMKAQAVHLQTVLSQKAIDEPGAKKPWWRFW
jgi:uncharacterized coiled-coil protein SlyX